MFETHKLNDRGFKTVGHFKQEMNDTVESILPLLPDGRDKSIFITKLEEAMFFGTRAIAAAKDNHSEVIKYTAHTETN